MTCRDGETCASFVEEVTTRDHRGLAIRRQHRGPVALDHFVNAACKMRDEEWWLTPPINEFRDIKSASIEGEIDHE